MRLFEFLQRAFGPCRDDDLVRLRQKVLDDGCAKAFAGAGHNEYFRSHECGELGVIGCSSSVIKRKKKETVPELIIFFLAKEG